MPDFIAYYRVSTDRQGATGLGLVIGREEAEEPLRRLFVRKKDGGQLRGQARECAGFLERDDFSAHGGLSASLRSEPKTSRSAVELRGRRSADTRSSASHPLLGKPWFRPGGTAGR